jgi:hypothetical protein
MSRVSLERIGGRDTRCTYSRKVEDYMADFHLVSQRTLDEQEHKVFRYHFLLGADWKLCCRFLKLERGNFFHLVYRIEQKLGRTFRELEPYGLYPLDEYFGGKINERTKVTVMPVGQERRLRPVIRKSA